MAIIDPPGRADDIPTKLLEVLRRPDIANELFLPAEIASWRQGRYYLERAEQEAARSAVGGVRLHESDESQPDDIAAAECQHDLTRLVRSLILLRREPELAGIVLSCDALQHEQLNNAAGRRVKFGLLVPNNDRFRDDRSAAREVHRQIVRAVGLAGFKVVQPAEPFDPKTGMDGLARWASQVRLRKLRNNLPLLLAAFLLPALLLFLWNCSGPKFIWGTKFEPKYKSLILVLDQSGSMVRYPSGDPIKAYEEIIKEAKEFLRRWKSRIFTTYYINIIKYDSAPKSLFGDLREADDKTLAKVNQFLDEPPSQGSTQLSSAMEKAAEEVARHGKPTTILILTDAQDRSIAEMNGNIISWKARFKGVPVEVNANTPQRLKPDVYPTASPTLAQQKKDEEELEKLATNLGGQLGLQREQESP